MAKQNYSDEEMTKYFNDPAHRNKRKKSGKWKKRLLIPALVLLLIIASFGFYVVSGLPSLEQLENPKPQLASKVYTVDGELLGQFFIENRIETDIDSIPQHLIDALVATEDRKFYSHWGVDMSRFIQAMIKNLFTFSREGASTITQQLAKNLYQLKSARENSFETGIRKIREWLTAIQIERTYTKNEIIELYLNVSYFGRSAYGVESAARVYFNKKGSELTLPESALFVALLKSPENYDPVRKTENAVNRRNLVMRNMVAVDKLRDSEYQSLKSQPIKLASERVIGMKSEAPHFLEYVRQQMTSMADRYGYDLYRDGLSIYTTIDMRMQKIANRVAAAHLKEYQEIFNKNWKWERNQATLTSLIDKAIKNSAEYNNAESKEDKAKVYNKLKYDPAFIDMVKKIESTIQVGFVVIDHANGQIKALVGGENQDFGRGLNHVTGIRRQPGSSFKPFIYTTAIDNGYSPSFSLLNEKFDYNGWSPSNADNEYGGYMTLRGALAMSVNVIAGRMTISEVAPPSQVVKFAKLMGINSPLQSYPSIALGTSEVSPLEITSAFGTIANGGVHVEPISILKIEDRHGISIAQFTPNSTEAISPQTASIVVDMMKDVINYGTGGGVRRNFQYPAAGKTGTTQNFSDAWFVGFTPDLVGGVWVGFDDHRVKFTNWYGQGAKASLPIWAKFMEAAYKELKIPLKYFELADGVKTVEFCKESLEHGEMRLAGPNCPQRTTDLVIESKMPPECEIHSGGGRIRREDQQGDTGW